MAIKKFLDKHESENSEEEIRKIIEKGAPVKPIIDEEEEPTHTFIHVRLTTKLVKRIDECNKKREGITRSGWILGAIQDKLDSQG